MYNSAKWLKKDKRNYDLVDKNGNVLFGVVDNTCNGNFVTDELLEQAAQEYFEEKEKENEQ
jgi:hypothetical protein